MPRVSLLSKTLPAAIRETLQLLGRNIRIARLRRRLRLEDLAKRVGVSRYVIASIEKGKPTVAIAAYVGVLWAMQLLDDLRLVGDPSHDSEGQALENMHAPKTAAKRKKTLDNDF